MTLLSGVGEKITNLTGSCPRTSVLNDKARGLTLENIWPVGEQKEIRDDGKKSGKAGKWE